MLAVEGKKGLVKYSLLIMGIKGSIRTSVWSYCCLDPETIPLY